MGLILRQKKLSSAARQSRVGYTEDKKQRVYEESMDCKRFAAPQTQKELGGGKLEKWDDMLLNQAAVIHLYSIQRCDNIYSHCQKEVSRLSLVSLSAMKTNFRSLGESCGLAFWFLQAHKTILARKLLVATKVNATFSNYPQTSRQSAI